MAAETQEEYVTVLGYAIGSLLETQSHLCAAYDRKYLAKAEFGECYADGTKLKNAIIAFIRSMIVPQSGVRSIRQAKTWSERTAEIYERVTGQRPPPPPGIEPR